ncbi:MAG: hypothetical protein GY858_02560, partial [Candidatus Omnitrophica bacterium]|nr:hypothetical protein [Candidatus Omnitrophota bacterium]
ELEIDFEETDLDNAFEQIIEPKGDADVSEHPEEESEEAPEPQKGEDSIEIVNFVGGG